MLALSWESLRLELRLDVFAACAALPIARICMSSALRLLLVCALPSRALPLRELNGLDVKPAALERLELDGREPDGVPLPLLQQARSSSSKSSDGRKQPRSAMVDLGRQIAVLGP